MSVGSINFNAGETFALGRFRRAETAAARSIERLATGQRINRASDDPSGLIASQGLKAERAQVLKQLESYGQELARYGALDGGLAGVGDLLAQLRGNITAAASTGGLSDNERSALQLDTDALIGGIAQTVLTTRFKGELLLSGYLGESAMIGLPGSDDQRASAGALLRTLTSGGTNNLLTGDLSKAQELVDGLVGSIAEQRAAVGGEVRRIESLPRELASRDENLAQALSGILDTDMAKETSELIRSQVVQQATLAAAQIARDLQKTLVVELLRGNVQTAKDAARDAARD
jgi:flagellin